MSIFKRNTKGFTLMEVLVSIAMVGIMFLPLMSVFSHSMKVNVDAKNKQRGNAVAASILEEVQQVPTIDALDSAYGYTKNADGTYELVRTGIQSDGKDFTAKVVVNPNAYDAYNQIAVPKISSLGSGSNVMGVETDDCTAQAIAHFQLAYKNKAGSQINASEVTKALRKTVEITLDDNIEAGGIADLKVADMATLKIKEQYTIDANATTDNNLKNLSDSKYTYESASLYHGNVVLSKLKAIYIFYNYDVDILQSINTTVNVDTTINTGWEPDFTIYALRQSVRSFSGGSVPTEVTTGAKPLFVRTYNGNIQNYSQTSNIMKIFSNCDFEVQTSSSSVAQGTGSSLDDIVPKEKKTRLSRVTVTVYYGNSTNENDKCVELTSSRGE